MTSQTLNLRKKAGFFAKIYLFTIIVLCLIPFTSAIDTAGSLYYDFGSRYDQWNSYDGTIVGTLSNVSSYPSFSISGDSATNSFDFSSGGYITTSTTGLNISEPSDSTATISLWFYNTAFGTERIFESGATSSGSRGVACYTIGGNMECSARVDDGLYSISGFSLPATDTWNNVILSINDISGQENVSVWVNGVFKGSATSKSAQSNGGADTSLVIGNRPTSPSASWDGYIDEVRVYEKVLNATERSNILNYGSSGGSGATPDNFSVNVKDFWDDDNINNIWVYVNSVNYTNATGNEVTTLLYENDTNTYNIEIGGTGHFKRTYVSQAVTNTLNAKLYANDITFRAYLINGTEINANITIETITKEENESFYLDTDNDILAQGTSGVYYPYNLTFNTTGKQNTTLNLTGFYTTQINISPRDILNNNTINDTNITLTSLDFSFNETINGVSNAVFNVTGGDYTLIIVAPDRTSYEENITINGSRTNYTTYAYMYAFNSLWIYAYKQADSTSIVNFNVSVSNANNSYSDSTTTGVVYLDNITSGVYDVVISAVGYASASYSVTMTDNSFQTLNAYLSGATDTFIFNIVNWNTYNIIEGATITQKRYVNDSLTTIASKTSNIVGQVPLTYENGVEYTFVASNTGYETRTFELEILQDQYTIRLMPISTTNESVYFDDVTINILNESFKEGVSYIVASFGSNGGSLENYSITIESVYNNTYVSGSNSVGGTLNASIVSNPVSFGETATITIAYKSTLNADYKYRTIIYAFDEWTADSGSLADIKEDVSGLSDLEKIFYATLLILFFAGIIGLGGIALGEGVTMTALGGIFGIVITGIIGLMAWKVAYAPLLILFLIVIFKLRGD